MLGETPAQIHGDLHHVGAVVVVVVVVVLVAEIVGMQIFECAWLGKDFSISMLCVTTFER